MICIQVIGARCFQRNKVKRRLTQVDAYRTNLHVDDPPLKPLLTSSAQAEGYSGGPSH
jgi:hypothetical protein